MPSSLRALDRFRFHACWGALACLAMCACARGGEGALATPSGEDAGPPAPSLPQAQDGGSAAGAPTDGPAGAATGGSGWVTVALEDFEHVDLGSPSWRHDPVPDDGPFADAGLWFTQRGISPPAVAYRLSQSFGADGWLTAESYTRDASTPFASLLSVVPDPADRSNHVLRLASPAHTDATVIRSSAPLPDRYRISLRVGFANFGDGRDGLNGYATGMETALPWRTDLAKTQNGFYWLAILDALPRPHNNSWIHHHRKVTFDSDNNFPPWTEIFDGQSFTLSGEHPLDMFALDGRGPRTELTGEPLITYADGQWQPSGLIRSVDSYLDREWYRVSIERSGTSYSMEVSGRFRYGGETRYRATIDAAAQCVWHFNRSPAEDASTCVDESTFPTLPGFPAWPAGVTWPDWFMFGDPHNNFYMGEVYYDDVRLEVFRP